MILTTGIGKSVERREDARLVTGGGTYASDVTMPGQAYACFVRSDAAHGIITSVDVETARGMPGVLGVFTGADLHAAGVGTIPYLPLAGYRMGIPVDTPRCALALDRVRYVGEQVALVVAETAAQALEACENVFVEIEHLPAAADVMSAIAPGAPVIWPEAGENILLTYEFGQQEMLDTVLAGAAHVTRVTLHNNRVLANPMELRAVVAAFDPIADRYDLTVSSQGVNYYLRGLLEGTLRLDPDQVRVRTHDVGGAFGNKEFPYPEDIAILHAARVIGRPIKWVGTRSEHFLSDNHAREAVIEALLALDADGNFLAIHADVLTNLGAYCSYVAPNTAIRNTTTGLAQVYRTPLITTRHRMVVTNRAPVGPYRGAGREQGALIVEALIDQAARELACDPVALRRRNLIPASAMPFQTAVGRRYDSGDFEGVLDRALELADWDGFDQRAVASARAGKHRGRGLSLFLEAVGGPPFDSAKIRLTGDGRVQMVLASQSSGQGHETSMAQVLVERLGVPLSSIDIQQGDSADIPRGMGSFASRTMVMTGSALARACDLLVSQGIEAAARIFGVPSSQVEFKDGMFSAERVNRRLNFIELAMQLQEAELADTLEASGEHTAEEFNFPNGCHICEVELNPDTGDVEVDRYTAVDDCGVVVNPMIVHGQIHGGVAQGIGQALRENIVYDDAGQLLTASLQDYALPRATDLVEPAVDFHVVPCLSNPLGVKGAGEAGVTGSVAAVSNAVHDALHRAGVPERVQMPFTRETVWRVLSGRPPT